MRALGVAFVLLTVAPTADPAVHEHPPPVVLAPGYADLEFTPPAPGSYLLPSLGVAADGAIVDSRGRALRLHELFGDKLVVMSFIFTRCSDVNGCPLATFVLRGVQDRIRATPELRDRVRLLSFSFDPVHDTPAVLEHYAGHFRQPGFDWHFVGARSPADLAPELEAYDQWVQPDVDGNFSHILRVYLIDTEKHIRNIYTVSFLHADTLLNDLRTVLAAPGVPPVPGTE